MEYSVSQAIAPESRQNFNDLAVQVSGIVGSSPRPFAKVARHTRRAICPLAVDFHSVLTMSGIHPPARFMLKRRSALGEWLLADATKPLLSRQHDQDSPSVLPHPFRGIQVADFAPVPLFRDRFLGLPLLVLRLGQSESLGVDHLNFSSISFAKFATMM